MSLSARAVKLECKRATGGLRAVETPLNSLWILMSARDPITKLILSNMFKHS